jgi:AcrR family transcriptional regulator
MERVERAPPERRERLLGVALELFTSHGIRRTSIEDIAAAAGIAKGSVYLEFRGKDELFRAVAERVVADILAAADAAAARSGALPDRVTDVLCAKFQRLYELVHSRPHARELIETKDAVALDVFRRADGRYAQLLQRVLEDADGWSPRKPHTAADVTAVLLRTAHGTSYGGGSKLSSAQFRQRLRLAVGIILDGAS